MNIKQRIIRLIPSKLYVILKGSGWFGNFNSWKEAEAKCDGYNNEMVFQKVTDSILKVKSGEALFERDSVVFDKADYNFPILNALMWIALDQQSVLKVIDFGGSLGSVYFQNRSFINSIQTVSWNVVEQSKFVEIGNKYIKEERLHFFNSISECVQYENCNCVLFSSVLQYIEDPYKIIDEVLKLNIEYILIDKTSFTLNSKSRITIQKVPKKIYDVSYPCWLLPENIIVDQFLSNGYRIIYEFENQDFINLPSIQKGFLFKKM